MLLQFSVSNYASIRNEVVFSLIPSVDREHPENIIAVDKYRANSLAAVYGANASGKSNLFKAMTNAIVYIRNSNLYQIGQPIPVVPYKFCEGCESVPTKFEFVFVAEDQKKYIYGFNATYDRVHEEYLYVFHSAKPSMLFERSGEEYRFPRAEKNNLQPLTRMNTSNKLFFATATAWNAECTTVPFRWFRDKIDTQTGTDNLQFQALQEYKEHKDENIRFVKELMKQADINITDIDIETKETPMEETPIPGVSFGVVINNQIIKPQMHFQTEINTGHRIVGENGIEKAYNLSLQEESQGTIQLFYFAPFLKKALETGKVLFIDEIDKSLHPFIVKYLINQFRNPAVNKYGAQLLFTTHDTAQLSLDTFRRDEIFFTEKDEKTGVTDLYSLGDYSVRKGENIEKGYLLGRYGAIPYLQTEEIL